MGFLIEVGKLYSRCKEIWNDDGGNDLEAIGGGFNVKLKALQDKRQRKNISLRLRELADINDKIVMLLKQGLQNTEY